MKSKLNTTLYLIQKLNRRYLLKMSDTSDEINTGGILYTKTPYELTIDIMLYWSNSTEITRKGIIKQFYSSYDKLLISRYNQEIDDFNTKSHGLQFQKIDANCIEKTAKFFIWFSDEMEINYSNLAAKSWPELSDHMIRKYIVAETNKAHGDNCKNNGDDGFRLIGPKTGIKLTYRCDDCGKYLELFVDGAVIKKKYTERMDTLHFLHSLDPHNLNLIISTFSGQ